MNRRWLLSLVLVLPLGACATQNDLLALQGSIKEFQAVLHDQEATDEDLTIAIGNLGESVDDVLKHIQDQVGATVGTTAKVIEVVGGLTAAETGGISAAISAVLGLILIFYRNKTRDQALTRLEKKVKNGGSACPS